MSRRAPPPPLPPYNFFFPPISRQRRGHGLTDESKVEGRVSGARHRVPLHPSFTRRTLHPPHLFTSRSYTQPPTSARVTARHVPPVGGRVTWQRRGSSGGQGVGKTSLLSRPGKGRAWRRSALSALVRAMEGEKAGEGSNYPRPDRGADQRVFAKGGGDPHAPSPPLLRTRCSGVGNTCRGGCGPPSPRHTRAGTRAVARRQPGRGPPCRRVRRCRWERRGTNGGAPLAATGAATVASTGISRQICVEWDRSRCGYATRKCGRVATTPPRDPMGGRAGEDAPRVSGACPCPYRLRHRPVAVVAVVVAAAAAATAAAALGELVTTGEEEEGMGPHGTPLSSTFLAPAAS